MDAKDQQAAAPTLRPITPVPAGEVAQRLLERARRQQREEPPPFKVVVSGLPSLDETVVTWWGLTVLAGDASSGKTTLATRIALETAREGGRVLWLGLGQGAETPVFRLLTGLARVRARAVFVERTLGAEDWSALEAAAAVVARLPLQVAEAHGATIEELRAGLLVALKAGPLDLAVLDDLGRPERPFLVSLEQLAEELDVPMLAVVAHDRRQAWRDERRLLRGPFPQRPGSLRLRLTRQEPDSILEPAPRAAPVWLDVYRAGEGFRRSIPLRFDPDIRWLDEPDAE